MKSYRSEIERLIPSLRQVARALVDNHRIDIADDLVHEAVEEALRNERAWSIDDLDVRLHARLFAANRVRLRAEMGERRTIPGGGGALPPARPAPAAPPARGPTTGLDTLALGDREALILVVLGRMDYAKAADVLGVPASTLIARLTHARDSLGTSLWSGHHPGERPTARPAHGSHLRLVKS